MNKIKFNLLIAGAVILVAADGNQPISIDEIANQNNQFRYNPHCVTEFLFSQNQSQKDLPLWHWHCSY